jgi:trigger factor
MPDNPEKTEESPAVAAPEQAPEGAAAPEEAEEKGVTATVERTGPCECVIRIEATAEHLEKRYQEELDSVHDEVTLPGFRRGKAPVTLVERRMGKSLRTDVVSSAIGEAYAEAVEENELNVVNQVEAPDLDELEWQPGQPLEVTFRCEVLPQVELSEQDYKGLQVEVPVLTATDELFEQEKERFAQQFATWEEVKGKGVDWDDYVEADAALVEGDWSETVQFYPRSEKIGPFKAEALRTALAEAKVGDEVQIEAEVDAEGLPEDSPLAPLAGRKVALKLTLLQVVRRHVPPIDDELARKLGLKDAAEIEQIVRQRLQAAVEERKNELTRSLLVEALMAKVDFGLPESLVERASRQEQLRALVRMLRAGVPREEAEQRAEEESGRTREGVTRRLKASYVLRKVAEKERILVTESEVQEQVRAFAARQGWREERASAYMEERGMLRSLRDDMRESKTLDFLVANARVQEISAEEFSRRHAENHAAQDAPAEPG